MMVPDEIRKCVAFVGLRRAESTYDLYGSVFFLGRGERRENGTDPMYVVTANHVITKIRETGVENACLRLNLKNGEMLWIETPLKDWFSHPNDTTIDVAILELKLSNIFDHLVYPFSHGITEDVLKKNEVGLGDEVFITGLFQHHHGKLKNIPIVRVGNIACMPGEKITTELIGDIDAYLIEARSIGGVSGSPVFLNLGVSRIIEGRAKFNIDPPFFYLIGLVHGHFDVPVAKIDHAIEGKGGRVSKEHVNTGIAIVVPFNKIDAVIKSYESQGRGAE